MPITAEMQRAYEQYIRRCNPGQGMTFEQFVQIAMQNRKAAKSTLP